MCSRQNLKPRVTRTDLATDAVERAHIIEVLQQTSGRIKGKSGAAEILGLNPATVYFLMKKLGIEKIKR